MLWDNERIEECRHVRTSLENSGVQDVRGSLWSPPKWRWLTEGGATEPVAEGKLPERQASENIACSLQSTDSYHGSLPLTET